MALLKIGSKGNQVEAWQTFLKTHSYLDGKADGIFGPTTKVATEKFQAANGLTVDGMAGPNTLAHAQSEGFIPPQSEVYSAIGFPPEGSLNAVFDISHNNHNVDLAEAVQGGMKAVFHKASQGVHFTDPKYADRRTAAQKAGLRWGAYHFGDGRDAITQATHFLSVAQPDSQTLLVLDYERNPSETGTTMNLEQARQFVQKVKTETGKFPGLYGGSKLSADLNGQKDEVLSQCWLWFAEYGSHLRMPPGWDTWTFWQYTDGKYGPFTEPVSGVGHCDRDVFNGDLAKLTAFWTGIVA
jgi:lysozyme